MLKKGYHNLVLRVALTVYEIIPILYIHTFEMYCCWYHMQQLQNAVQVVITSKGKGCHGEKEETKKSEAVKFDTYTFYYHRSANNIFKRRKILEPINIYLYL